MKLAFTTTWRLYAIILNQKADCTSFFVLLFVNRTQTNWAILLIHKTGCINIVVLVICNNWRGRLHFTFTGCTQWFIISTWTATIVCGACQHNLVCQGCKENALPLLSWLRIKPSAKNVTSVYEIETHIHEMIVLYSGDTIRQSCFSTEKDWWRSNPHHTGENYNCSDAIIICVTIKKPWHCFMISKTTFAIYHSGSCIRRLCFF